MPSTVCPNGARAALETASLQYTSAATGWGRLDDLVDEQEGPFYFMAWEPNFPDPVTVRITLAEPVLASDLRVFQDPFTEVGGSIQIVTDSEAFSIGLSGVDGWRVNTFAEPTVITAFTVARTQMESNIMEVMICLAP